MGVNLLCKYSTRPIKEMKIPGRSEKFRGTPWLAPRGNSEAADAAT